VSAAVLDRRAAATIVEDALGAVFEPAVVRQLREDSPLSMLGMALADAVCVSDAIADAAEAAGLACDLGDGILGSAVTVADLVSAVQETARPTGEEHG
jgi:hypothetical protein